uniref:Uncharacterized protein MANES_04G010900 n=1 Tax=Rhizophora mucronata TaxID=61149 RepID=A0A2P2KG58_RHIMU
MAVELSPKPVEEEDRQQQPEQKQEHEAEEEEEAFDAPSHHPSAPPDELFDISTTVDPSYIISLIRKLIPATVGGNHSVDGINTGNDCGKVYAPTIMDVVDDDSDKSACQEGESKDLSKRSKCPGMSTADEVWEEYGCVLWDLAASRTHAELMVQNHILEVLLANLRVSKSVRATEISLGILGNLACHEVPLKCIISTNGMIETIIEQLFSDDIQCLCEASRLLTVGLQGGESTLWAKALHSEHILGRILWIVENTLNVQLLERSTGLILAIIESSDKVISVLTSLMKLNLPNLLVSLLAFEMINLTGDRVPERYSVLDVVLRATEALSSADGHSQEICTNKELFKLVCDLVKLPDKVEVASSCVTAAVLIANILSDVPDLALDLSEDLPFLDGLLDMFPFASDDVEARSAIWSILARILVRVKENEMSLSSLRQYVLILVSKSDLIEDDLLDRQLDNLQEESKSSTSSGMKPNARRTAIERIIRILNQWNASRKAPEWTEMMLGYGGVHVNVDRLLDCCCRHFV